MFQVNSQRSNPTPERSAGVTRGGGGGRPPPIMHGAAGGTPDPGGSEGEVSEDERGGMRDERPDKRSKKPVEKENTDQEKYEKLRRTKYGSPGPWEKPLQKPQKVQHNPHQNTTMRTTRISGSG